MNYRRAKKATYKLSFSLCKADTEGHNGALDALHRPANLHCVLKLLQEILILVCGCVFMTDMQRKRFI